jgi:hypothetical protein
MRTHSQFPSSFTAVGIPAALNWTCVDGRNARAVSVCDDPEKACSDQRSEQEIYLDAIYRFL